MPTRAAQPNSIPMLNDPELSDYPSEDQNDHMTPVERRRLRRGLRDRLKQKSVLTHLVLNILGFIVIFLVIGVGGWWVLSKTPLGSMLDEYRMRAELMAGMKRRLSFSATVISNAYIVEGVEPLEKDRGLAFFGNHDAAILKGKRKKDSKPVSIVAIQRCSLDRRDEADQLVNTLLILGKIDGLPGIPKLVEFFEDRVYEYFVLEPPLDTQLRSVKFKSEEDAIMAMCHGLNTLARIHKENMAMLWITELSIFVRKEGIFLFPSPIALPTDSSGQFTLRRGQYIPKVKPQLRPGDRGSQKADVFLLGHAFRRVKRDFKGGQLQRILERMTDEDEKTRPTAKQLYNELMKGRQLGPLEYSVGIEKKMHEFKQIKEDKADCQIPTFDYMMDGFRRIQSRLDQLAG